MSYEMIRQKHYQLLTDWESGFVLIFGRNILSDCSLFALLESKNATAFKISFSGSTISIKQEQ